MSKHLFFSRYVFSSIDMWSYISKIAYVAYAMSCILFIYIYTFIYTIYIHIYYLCDYLCKISLKNKSGNWRRQWLKWNANTEQRDEIGVAAQSQHSECELKLSQLERLSGIQWALNQYNWLQNQHSFPNSGPKFLRQGF